MICILFLDFARFAIELDRTPITAVLSCQSFVIQPLCKRAYTRARVYACARAKSIKQTEIAGRLFRANFN